VGLVVAIVGSRWMASLLFAVSPTDLVTLLAVTFALLGVALVACRVPARRAVQIDPVQPLRSEA